ncbi:MAG: deoxynucleoside kinase [Gammaproteobacteria bacterium]|jgi:deoxyguanosine kinase|nr:deoxynucleoside kinase [Gammaproteobacteria bacterium]MBT4462661.1 deoxynucleoside kinase [Gammaproteobacteria bacterium]MBT4654908.1 deoxynucleoside kinase [Gammaproteobacteria bacterium]MBT5116592.1 deoxynucleoside kinase [Gammaproteobacteria bacterium]MBT5761781.1 deoxynucleoside kinase [Gammaproteobacteria bacterium]
MKNMYKSIIVEGPIGVGKTTLATKLSSSLESMLVLEKYSENPFLEKFYKDVGKFNKYTKTSKHALSTQLFFLLQRADDFKSKEYLALKNHNIISDYFIDKDKLFAKAILSTDEYLLYNKVYDALNLDIEKPSLVIYLQTNAETLMSRIKKRGIGYETNITEAYLKKIIDSYTLFFHSYKESPLLIINTSNVNVNDPHDYAMLLEQINKDIKGKIYLNPLSQ